MTKIIINGANGNMGQASVNAIEQNNTFELVATLGKNDDLAAAIKNNGADIVIDFTTPKSVYENTLCILNNNAHPVIGTTGLSPQQIKTLQMLAKEKNLGGVIAPNFSIGAVLMMQYANEFAKHYQHAEIIEMHHDKKKDAPSGTAIKTAQMISGIKAINHCEETLPGALGAKENNIAIHSVRLPGLVAHQQIIFGGLGETLTLRHDTINREAFMPGVILACEKVFELDTLVYGLEHLL